MRYVKTLLGAGLGLLLAAALAGCEGNSDPAARRASLGLPDPTHVPDIERGIRTYATNCISCHGPGAQGTEQGPPLVHGYYRPDHHADYAFFMAAKNGVVQHHWEFGDMPPQPQVNPEQVADIAAYVRSLQRQAGLIQ